MEDFCIEGKNSKEARTAIAERLDELAADFADGDMKAGRYIGLYYLLEAAERGDITSQVAVGNLAELGTVLDQSDADARFWYQEAIAKDHPKKDGTMLAAGATAGLQRLAE